MLATHCPICGFGPFQEPYLSLYDLARSSDICPCCCCHYGFDDCTDYREEWIASGAPWAFEEHKSEGWSLAAQLENAIEGWEQLWFAHCPEPEQLARYQRDIERYFVQLHSPEPRRRFAAVRILETLEDPRVEPELEAAAKHDPDDDVRAVAHHALCHRRGESPFETTQA